MDDELKGYVKDAREILNIYKDSLSHILSDDESVAHCIKEDLENFLIYVAANGESIYKEQCEAIEEITGLKGTPEEIENIACERKLLEKEYKEEAPKALQIAIGTDNAFRGLDSNIDVELSDKLLYLFELSGSIILKSGVITREEARSYQDYIDQMILTFKEEKISPKTYVKKVTITIREDDISDDFEPEETETKPKKKGVIAPEKK